MLRYSGPLNLKQILQLSVVLPLTRYQCPLVEILLMQELVQVVESIIVILVDVYL